MRRRRPVRLPDPVEVAEAAALGDLVAVVCVLTRLIPVGPIGTVVAAFPLAVLALRRAGRVAPVGVLTAGVVAFLVGGVGPGASSVSAGLLGWVVGVGARRGWRLARTALTGGVLLGGPAAALAVGVLGLFAAYRELALDQLRNSWSGAARVARASRVPSDVLAGGDRAVHAVTTYWWAFLPALIVLSTLAGVAFAAALMAGPLRTVGRLLPGDLAGRLSTSPDADTAIAPLPLRVRDVPVPSGEQVSLDLDAARFVVVTGANGAGKSTLGRIVAGQVPPRGSVSRSGDAGLGRVGGTGMIFQRPESQVLGVRVADDLRWGLPPGHPVPVDDLLARVGLADAADRETATLSGGELQRLAVAALLARRPSVVVSDESTAMLDTPGRAEVTELLQSLAHGPDRIGVVHITHHDTAGADAVVALSGAGDDAPPPTPDGWGPPRPPAGATLRLRGVDLVHDPGTPWRRPVLTGVDLTIPAGAMVLVTGPNGAGKTTLAWTLAGLISPARGTATLDGAPLRNGRGQVLLAVQHARPALLRATVTEEVQDAAGVGPLTADATLGALGLDPDHYRDRPIDALSGGEQRRVLLAGLLGAGPRALVLDEPLAGLDPRAASALRDALAAARAAGTTLVVVTHDTSALADLADAELRIDAGRVTGPPEIVGPPRADAGDPPVTERRARSGTGAVRTLPGASPMHRLWAGTKVAALLALAVTLAVRPTWWTLAGTVLLVVGGALVARVPRGAVPRPPRWLWIWLLPAVLASLSVQPPLVRVGGTVLSAGGLEGVVLLLGTTLVSLAGAVLLVATTPLSAFPPLLQRLARLPGLAGGPSRGRIVPAIALGLRLMPLLLAEGRTTWLLLVQRRHVERVPPGLRERLHQAVGVALLACSMALRRAGETGEAITARGGLGAVAGPDQRPGARDVVAVLVVVAVLGLALWS